MAERKRAFVRELLRWGKTNARSFPWRENQSPFEVFISEILLKRTTSTAVARVYPGFLRKFPDISSLVKADTSAIEDSLRPIGLYKQRSEGLKEAAKYLLEHFEGVIPCSYEELLEVPHIGHYTAGAIMSFGFGSPAPIVDSNVRRVVTRVFCDIFGNSPNDKILREFLEEILPEKNHKLFNWSLIDFGFLICSYRTPKHSECPLKQICHHVGIQGRTGF